MDYKQIAYTSEEPTIEFKPGIWKTTLAYIGESMLCHFQMKKGSTLALHEHEAVQNGFILSGRIEFFKEDGSSFVVGAGDGYVFGSYELHGSKALEDVDFIECFNPMRPEYVVTASSSPSMNSKTTPHNDTNDANETKEAKKPKKSNKQHTN